MSWTQCLLSCSGFHTVENRDSVIRVRSSQFYSMILSHLWAFNVRTRNAGRVLIPLFQHPKVCMRRPTFKDWIQKVLLSKRTDIADLYKTKEIDIHFDEGNKKEQMEMTCHSQRAGGGRTASNRMSTQQFLQRWSLDVLARMLSSTRIKGTSQFDDIIKPIMAPTNTSCQWCQ